MKIKITTVIDAVEQADDSYRLFYDTKTNETVFLADSLITGETNEGLADLIDREPDRFL